VELILYIHSVNIRCSQAVSFNVALKDGANARAFILKRRNMYTVSQKKRLNFETV